MNAGTNCVRRRAPKDPYDQRVWLGRTKQEERFWLALLSSLGRVSSAAVVSRPDIRATLTLTRRERLGLFRTNHRLSIRRYTRKLRRRRGAASIDVTITLRDWDRLLRRLSVQVASMNRSRTLTVLQGLVERIEALLAEFDEAVPPTGHAQSVGEIRPGLSGAVFARPVDVPAGRRHR